MHSAMLFWKTKNVKTRSFLLGKNVDKKLSFMKILSTIDHLSLKYGTPNLLFCLTDS